MHTYNPEPAAAGNIADGLQDLHAAFQIKFQKELQEKNHVQEAKKRAFIATLSNDSESHESKKPRR